MSRRCAKAGRGRTGERRGENPGDNACKGMGSCHVPVESKSMWKSARKYFEEKMKKEGKTVGDAPTAVEKKDESPKDEVK